MKKPLMIGALVIAPLSLLFLAAACSQHQPGPWEGGGRTYDNSSVSGSTSQDAGQDNFIPDSFVPFDGFVGQ